MFLPLPCHLHTPSGAASVPPQHRNWLLFSQAGCSSLSVTADNPGPQGKSLHNPSMAHSPGNSPELAIEDCIGMAAKDNTPVQVILLVQKPGCPRTGDELQNKPLQFTPVLPLMAVPPPAGQSHPLYRNRFFLRTLCFLTLGR